MKVFFAVIFTILFSFIARQALGQPIEIIFRGGDCSCAGPEYKSGCEHGILQSYSAIGDGSRLSASTTSCNTPRYRIRNQNNNVKYIFDYDVEVPVETSRFDLPLTNLVAKVDKILIDEGSPKYVNSGCLPSNLAGAAEGVVAPIPLPGRICSGPSSSYGHH